jgi:hypothetical protein
LSWLIQQSEHNCDVFFGFYRLTAERGWLVTPPPNGARSRRHKQGRTPSQLNALYCSIPADNGVKLNCAFDSLLLCVRWVNRINA